jgi:hypothetical protein
LFLGADFLGMLDTTFFAVGLGLACLVGFFAMKIRFIKRGGICS